MPETLPDERGCNERAMNKNSNKARILVLAAEEICGPCLAQELTRHGKGPEDASVVLIAPSLVRSATTAQTDDIDAAIVEAQRTVDASVARLEEQGYTVSGKVGDSDPGQAIEDGLAEFPSEEVIVATHPPDREERLEKNLIDRVTRDIGIDVTHVVVRPEHEHLLPRFEEVKARAPTSAERATEERRKQRDYLALFMGVAGIVILGLLALTGAGTVIHSAAGKAQLLIAAGAFCVAVFYAIGLIAFEAAGYRGMWAKLTSDSVFVVIPVALVASIVLSIVRG
jgi:hypothetical protein